MFAVLIEENTDYKTDIKEFGSSSLVFEALNNKQIDLLRRLYRYSLCFSIKTK